MIKAEYEENFLNRKTCYNCKRAMPVTILWNIDDNEIRLCEDCSNALSTLHHIAMTEAKDCMYLEDQVWKTI